MLNKLKTLALISTIFASSSLLADIPYCKDTQTSNGENTVLQTLVAQFAKDMQCEVGKNCLRKWDNQQNPSKFSIAWKATCGPVINGVLQLGDNGKGSTFVCQRSAQSTCCWPLGYGYAKQYVICSHT